jgi:Ca-activated chloride channel family protein
MDDLFGLLTTSGSNPVPLMGVRVTGDILGRGARVKVAQRFLNNEAQAIEAVYRFPLPETAAVCGFSAIAGGRRITGSVEEREKAFETYDDALARGDGAFLLDQERPNIFTLSVGSLPSGAEAVVEIEYVALLDQRGKEIRFALPTTISPRYLPADTPDEGGIPAHERIHPEYAASVPYGLSVEIAVRDPSGVESVESPSHPISVSMGKGGTTGDAATVVRFASDAVTMDRDFVLTIVQRGKDQGRAWRFTDGKIAWVQLDLAPDEVEGAPCDRGRREAIFVLDCSGSMQGDSIDQAKRALEVCLKAMETGCSFNIVRFGSRRWVGCTPSTRTSGEPRCLRRSPTCTRLR